MTPLTLTRLATASALSLLLAACGGGSDDPVAGASAGGATVTLSATTPAAMATTLDLATATSKGNSARAADSFSSLPYCEIFWENVTGANGKKYALQVYFRQGDKLPMHVSAIEAASGWAVFNNASGAAIAGISVDTATKTVAFNNKLLAGGGTELATLAGTVGFPANATTAACGA